MSQSEEDTGDPRSGLPSQEKQRQSILNVIEEEDAPWVAVSTLEDRLPYECSRPTIETRLEELELQNEIRERPFNPHAESSTKLYHLVHEETEWMAPPDATLLTEQEEQLIENLRDEEDDLPDPQYVRQPYEHHLLDTRIGDCFYQGHNFFGDLALAGLGLTIPLYIAFEIASILPVSRGSIAIVLLFSILATMVGCFGILGSAGFKLAREATQ
ncbi:hypothetical protein [Salinibaculum salinum]|uniref:hypothetical protein n=1 Tax=Salinibaculum salinum TaxID=3131996 RepID=UPI0030ECF273